MSGTTTLNGYPLNRRRLARIVYLGVFVALYYGTDVFARFQILLWLGMAGLVVVFFDAVICARRRWRVVRSEMRSDSEGTDSSP